MQRQSNRPGGRSRVSGEVPVEVKEALQAFASEDNTSLAAQLTRAAAQYVAERRRAGARWRPRLLYPDQQA